MASPDDGWCGIQRCAIFGFVAPVCNIEEAVKMRRQIFAVAAGLALLSACGMADERAPAVSVEMAAPALESVDAGRLLGHIEVLASDEFEGRLPGTVGEERTVSYLLEQLQGLGLEPGNPDGTFTQDVTLVGIRSATTGSIAVGDRTLPLRFPDNFVGVSYREGERVTVDGSEMVFVGYGVEAPEYDWDDYKGQDMTGKTLVMLVSDPPVPHPDDPERLDPDMFNGEAMTLYGRWTYKYEVGAAKGADAVLIVHETGPAGYPWDVVTGSWGGENMTIASDGASEPLKVEAWITDDFARELFAAAGHDFDELKEQARTPAFEPVPLGATADVGVDLERRSVESQNVIAKVRGAHAERADEYIIYVAHWDHLGRDGDLIYNGAVDNATGTSALVEMARAYTRLPEPPDRSILFLAVTAEEQGLLGARHYAENPLYPLERTLAVINMDAFLPLGRTEDVIVIGRGSSTLEDVLERHAAAQDRVVEPDAEPEKGFFYRSDHFEFAKQGVPALYIDTGTRVRDRPEGWGLEQREAFTVNDYHKPTDVVRPDWDLSGLVEDVQLLFLVGYDVSQTPEYPNWLEGNEFRARRDAMTEGR
jgi:Zn-dependent M28 family amino/carboxypeptidase